MRTWTRALAALPCVVALAAPAFALTFTCETVTRDKGPLDPDGQPIKAKFEAPAINGAGDVVFHQKSKDGRRRLYLYPDGGAASVIAREDDPAPSGGVYVRFRDPTIDDAGDVAFAAALVGGEGVFHKPAAGAVATVAVTGDPAPGGGVFDRFPGISRLNAAGDVAFAATVSGAPRGLFLYDASGPTVSSIVREGDPTGTGRTFCGIQMACQNGASCDTIALGGGGLVGFIATTQVNCADTMEVGALGLWQQTGLGFVEAARVGDPTPVAGTTYKAFAPRGPDANAGDQLAFSADVQGVLRFTGHFLFDAGGPTTSLLVATNDAAPGAGGALTKLSQPSVSDGGRAGVGARIKSGSSRNGLFLFDGVDEPVVLETDPVPSDLFGPGALYKKINSGTNKTRGEIGFDRSGTRAVYSAKVKDSVAPIGKTGLFRCAGM